MLGINPFDQPDVEAAKIKTKALMEAGGTKQTEKPLIADGPVALYADAANAKALDGRIDAGGAI